jgi:succinoglycan biosynthesis transport protein ExoP
MTAPERVTSTFDSLASRVDAMGFRTIGFTSTLLGEGVSTLALGTALSLAGLRRGSVLLVDANWIHPSLTRDARLESSVGLADLLADHADPAACIRQYAPSRVAFLPLGDGTGAKPTLRGIASFIAKEAGSFETVIVDLPPVLAGETFVLPWAALLDQLFVVLREGATPLPMVRQALGKLSLASPPYIVLNRARGSSVDVPAALLAARA